MAVGKIKQEGKRGRAGVQRGITPLTRVVGEGQAPHGDLCRWEIRLEDGSGRTLPGSGNTKDQGSEAGEWIPAIFQAFKHENTDIQSVRVGSRELSIAICRGWDENWVHHFGLQSCKDQKSWRCSQDINEASLSQDPQAPSRTHSRGYVYFSVHCGTVCDSQKLERTSYPSTGRGINELWLYYYHQ